MLLTILLLSGLVAGADLPLVRDLPELESSPDPLVMLDGTRVSTPRAWNQVRRPELLELFLHYMYGHVPPRPADLIDSVVHKEARHLGGTATRKTVLLRFGPERKGRIVLTIVTPKGKRGVPCLFGLNLDQALAEEAVRRGFAFATFDKEDVAPDANDFTRGIYPLYFKPGQVRRGPHDWGAIAAWAWGLGTAADYLSRDRSIDSHRLVVVGHSRAGKAALLAAALDGKIAAVIAHQSGMGGAAPNRIRLPGRIETVADIVRLYPHWFAGVFASFSHHPERIPFSQSGLLSLIAPRPVLLGNEPHDTWTNPRGQLRILRNAAPVYRLLGVETAIPDSMPVPGATSVGPLAYYSRAQRGHELSVEDWRAFMDFVETRLPDASPG